MADETVDRLLDSVRHVVGQDVAKRRLASILRRQQHTAEGRYERSYGGLMFGPTGAGKTLMGRAMCAALGLPFAEANATQYTETGYAGMDLSQMFQPLLVAAIKNELKEWQHHRILEGEDSHLPAAEGLLKMPQEIVEPAVERMQVGVVLLDEFDKWVLTSGDDHQGRNPGKKLQAELLKIMEGSTVFVRDEDSDLGIPINTERICILCCGAFVGLHRIVTKRLNPDGAAADMPMHEAYSQMIPPDLVAFGLLPELVGRLTSWVPLRELDTEDFISIMTAEGGDLREYTQRFADEDARLVVEDGGLRALAGLARSRKTGARGIRNVLENLMMDALFEAALNPGGTALLSAESVHRQKVLYAAA